MVLRVPTGLSPSKVESFTSCPLAFKFSAIDKLPEPPAPAATKGTLVHRALELLLDAPAPERTLERALAELDRAFDELSVHHDYTGLELTDEAAETFLGDAEKLVRRYFELEDPRSVTPIGLELRVEVDLDGLLLRGIIDRLELDDDGELVVTDYKTGRAPSERYEQGRLGGVHFYAYLCERLFGRRPTRIQLLYLSQPIAIIATPSDQSIRFLPKKVGAVWSAVERACATDDFRPKPGMLCGYCAFKPWCPSHGGDPAQALVEAPVLYGRKPVAAPLPA